VHWILDDSFLFLSSLGFAIIFFLLLRAGKNALCLLVGLLPTAIPLFLNKDARIYGWHHWLQNGTAYQILNGYVPPDNALFAGHICLYPWGYPYLLAVVSRILNVTPFISSALVSVSLLAFLLFVTFQISKMIFNDRVANLFSVLVPIYAFTFTQNFNFAQILSKICGLPPPGLFCSPLFDCRVNILYTFIGNTGYPAGIAFFALFLFGLMRVLAHRRADLKAFISLCAGVLCLGFLYPFMFLAVYPIVFLVLTNDLLKKRFNKSNLMVILILLSGTLILYPYFISFAAHRAPGAGITLDRSLRDIICRKAVISFVTFVPIVLLLFLFRQTLKRIFDKKDRLWEVLLLSIAACLVMYLGLHACLGNEYKFLALACFCIGIPGGFAFAELYRKKPYLCVILLGLFLLPTTLDVKQKLTGFHSDTQTAFTERGVDLVSRSSDHAFYEWVRKYTNKEDVFVDSNLEIPILGQRRLYIGWNHGEWEPGYVFPPKVILCELNGYDFLELQDRWNFVQMLFDKNAPLNKEMIKKAVGSLPGSKMYFVARNTVQRDRFLKVGIFSEVFSGGAISVFVFKSLEKP
jgi:hypothetical protein